MAIPPTPTAGNSRTRVALCVAVAVLCGGLVSVQSRINGQLGGELGDGFVAAVISFGSGLVIITIAVLISRAGRRGIRTVTIAIRSKKIPVWHAFGGIGGALFVLSQGLVVGVLGIALFTVAIVAGQTISGLLIDARGIGTVRPKPVTITRVAGAALAVVAVVVAVLPQLSGQAHIWVIVFPAIVGLLLGFQQALNGQIKTLADSATTATFFNFLVGTALLLVFAVVNIAIAGVPKALPASPILYLGGVIGVLFIAGFAAVVPIIGVLLQSLAAVSGQLVMALVLDYLAPADDLGVGIATIIGTALALVAVVVASLRSRALRRPD